MMTQSWTPVHVTNSVVTSRSFGFTCSEMPLFDPSHINLLCHANPTHEGELIRGYAQTCSPQSCEQLISILHLQDAKVFKLKFMPDFTYPLSLFAGCRSIIKTGSLQKAQSKESASQEEELREEDTQSDLVENTFGDMIQQSISTNEADQCYAFILQSGPKSVRDESIFELFQCVYLDTTGNEDGCGAWIGIVKFKEPCNSAVDAVLAFARHDRTGFQIQGIKPTEMQLFVDFLAKHAEHRPAFRIGLLETETVSKKRKPLD